MGNDGIPDHFGFTKTLGDYGDDTDSISDSYDVDVEGSGFSSTKHKIFKKVLINQMTKNLIPTLITMKSTLL